MVAPLQDKLDFIFQGYNRLVHGLQLFVDEMRKGMAGSRENLADLSARTQDVRVSCRSVRAPQISHDAVRVAPVRGCSTEE
jgi:hypothetical protein